MTAEYRPADWLVGWAAVWGVVRVSVELASQLPAVAVVGKKRTRGQLSVAPGVVGLALLEAEFDATVVEFARHDAHRADGQVKRGAGEPVADGGGGGEEAHAGQLSVAPGVVCLALLEAELDAAVVEFARHDPHGRAVAGGVLLGGGSGGDDGAADDGEQGDDRSAGAAPANPGAATGSGHVRRAEW